MTKYHSQYQAYYITLQQPNNSTHRLGWTFLNATIDLNPHQVQGALSYFESPLSKGIILADEVGLGKTIEAGLIVCQLWSEFKRKMVLIVPASLRKQRKSELEDKFFLDSMILDGKSYKKIRKQTGKNPFDQKKIVITSYAFASKHDVDVLNINWDLIVLDEAHKLRNIYKDKKFETRAGKLYKAIKDKKKLLLTATPLQNSLMELYGLTMFIDDYTFGDVDSFRKQFSKPDRYKLEELRLRMKPLVNRTLRQQVKEYIRYTDRISITQNFEPTDTEMELYQKVSEFLQRENLESINPKTKHLIILILRKLLASSSHAISGTLNTMIQRLKAKHNLEQFTDEEDLLENYDENIDNTEEQQELMEQMEQLSWEIEELKGFLKLAQSIQTDTKAKALLIALEKSFPKLHDLWANKKALIFTESRRTQDYLKVFLESNGYEWKVVLFNGSNSSVQTKEIYKNRLCKHEGTSKVSWSKEADTRASLVEYFKEEAEIMIATESASEWVNMQFCSLLINYDLPWNPQRIEQRIGRCHRYGQKHDVLVVNFLNTKNQADKRVYELLSQKFELFDGVFGASDEILGSLDDGTNFEQRILKIYQQSRTPEEIDQAFNELQNEYKDKIDSRITEAKKNILEYFDAEVLKRLKDIQAEGVDSLDIYQKYFWYMTKYELFDKAQFDDEKLIFDFHTNDLRIPVTKWKYTLKKENLEEARFYRPNSDFGQALISRAKERKLEPGQIVFLYEEVNPRITWFRDYKGQSWYLRVDKLIINTFDYEEYLVVTMITDEWELIHHELAQQVFHMPWEESWAITIPDTIQQQLVDHSSSKIHDTYHDSMDRNSNSFQDEIAKLDAWEEDRKLSLLRELDEIKEEIQTRRKESLKTDDRDLKLQLRQDAMKLEVKQRKKQEQYFSQVKEIEDQKRKLIQEIEDKMQAGKESTHLFSIRRTIK